MKHAEERRDQAGGGEEGTEEGHLAGTLLRPHRDSAPQDWAGGREDSQKTCCIFRFKNILCITISEYPSLYQTYINKGVCSSLCNFLVNQSKTEKKLGKAQVPPTEPRI